MAFSELSHGPGQRCLLRSETVLLPMGDRTWGSVLKVGTDHALLTKWIKFSPMTACLRETLRLQKAVARGSRSQGAGNRDVKLLPLWRENELVG